MRIPLLLLVFISTFITQAQHKISGRILDANTGNPLAYVNLETSEGIKLHSNIDGTFNITYSKPSIVLHISYVGYQALKTNITNSTEYIVFKLSPYVQKLEAVVLTQNNPPQELIKKAIAAKGQNNPEEALDGFTYKNYTKFIIDNSEENLNLQVDSTGNTIETIIMEGREYLSEKVSNYYYRQKGELKESVIGIKTAGFKKPVYEVLALEVNPFSLYAKDYSIFNSKYAGPLAKDALKNYTYKILDTTSGLRPAYVLYFKPKREQTVAGLEGILHIDTTSFAIQEAKAQLLGAIKLEVKHNYSYYPEKDLWFPKSQITTIQPGSGGKDISVFGGVIEVGTLQKKHTILDKIAKRKEFSKNLYLRSASYNYNIQLKISQEAPNPAATIEVQTAATVQPKNFWEENRKEEFTQRDESTQERVAKIIKNRRIERKIQVKKALANGYYPVGFWDFKIGKFIKYNTHEGIRAGMGGKTNELFSDNFNLGGYGVYGFKDKQFKYQLQSEIYLNKATGTKFNLNYTSDITEVGSFEYLQGHNDFSIILPRFVNIDFYYAHKTWSTGIQHRVTSKLGAELRLQHSSISQIEDYTYNLSDQIYKDYKINEAQFSFIWRPFSVFLRTPKDNILIKKEFPKFTGQINQAFSGLIDGDFNFTKLGLKIEHEIVKLDQSRTEIILEGNYGFGDIPLTHAFHSYPNNPNKEDLLHRFSVAGRNSFETMYFNEFFSDKQVMLHLRHQLRPFNLGVKSRPELVLLSRFVIGDMENKARHQNIEFQTLEKGYTEVGLELNKIFYGFGLSTAYRYGAYHLPDFKDNISLKFTFQLLL